MQPSQRIHLTVGPPLPMKIVSTVIAVIFIGGSLAFMAAAYGLGLGTDTLTTPLATGDPDLIGFPDGNEEPTVGPDLGAIDSTGNAVSAIFKLSGLCGVPFVVLGGYLLLRLWRDAAWLDGTILTRRGAILRRKVDLTTADVSMAGINFTQHSDHGSHQHRTVVRVPALALTEVGSGRTTKLPLRGQGLDLLPASQLRALADALEQNRSVSAERARAIAARLRSLAADPLAY